MRNYHLILWVLSIMFSIPLSAQKYTISGYINDSNSGERLIGANVYERETLTGSVTNNYGFYSLPLSSGVVEVVVSYMGYELAVKRFILSRDTTLHFSLIHSTREIEEVTIIGGRQSKVESTQMSMVDIPVEKFLKLPVLLGEADVLKVIQLLPGVQSGTEGSTGIYVRGGGPDQNLFLLDGVPVYNASHLFGFLSVFNPDAIKAVQLYKGGFPARYGERLSSVVDIRMKDGNDKEVHGNFSFGLISSKLSLEGPLIKDKTSFIVSGRRTYADILARPLIAYANKKYNENSVGGYYFYDLNAKISHTFSEKSRLYLSSYLGDDEAYFRSDYSPNYPGEVGERYEYKDKFGMSWGNTITALRWNYLLNNKLFSNTTFTYSKYNFNIFSESKSVNHTTKKTDLDYFRYFSGIEDLSAKIDFDYYPTANHSLKYGAAYTYHNFKPGVTRFKFDFDDNGSAIDTTFGDQKIFANEFIGYAEDNFDISSRLRVNMGVRLALFNVQNTNYLSLQPRISFRYLATKDLSFKASYSKMAQFVHLLTTSAISLPTDLWLPVTKKFEPPISHQFAIGSSYRLPWKMDLTVEGYYKSMNNLIEYKEGASFGGTGLGWESKVEKGRGWAYGAEILLEKSLGKTSGWLGYTISRSDRKFENLNFGRVFPAKYDRRHDVSLALTHKFNEKKDIGLVWVYGTGHAATLGVMKYPVAPLNDLGYYGYHYYQDNTEYTSRNNYRAPSYHRLDLGFNMHKEKKHGIRTWNISVYNSYNRKNPFFIFWGNEYYNEPDPNNPQSGYGYSKPVLKKISLFPLIPSVSYSYSF
jgi:hypothetical protein